MPAGIVAARHAQCEIVPLNKARADVVWVGVALNDGLGRAGADGWTVAPLRLLQDGWGGINFQTETLPHFAAGQGLP
jgi:hypothetical protein